MSGEGVKKNIETWLFWLGLLLPVVLTLIVYFPSLHNQFVNWDDTEAIQWNPHLRALTAHNLYWMLTAFHLGNWIPLTWISLALDYQVSGLDPWRYHFHNLLLHCLNTVWVYLLSVQLLHRMEKTRVNEIRVFDRKQILPTAFLAALLFGLHPLHVESVAWATERKDVLYGFFFLLSLLLYLDYGSYSKPNDWKLHGCLGLFFLSLISKPMAITLPFVFLVLDLWPLDRVRNFGSRVWKEKISFLVLALLFLAVSVLAQAQAGSYSNLSQIPISYRIMNLLHTPFYYLSKMVFPVGLTTLYPIDLRKTYSPEYVIYAMGTAFSIAYGFFFWKKRPYLAVAGLFYLICLLPVIGILQIGSQAAADRFTYLPSLGPFLLFSALSVRLLFHKRFVWFPLVIGLTISLSIGTIQQTRTWENTITLWENVLRIIPRNCQIAHANLADGYLKVGRWADAILEFDRGIRLGPPSAFSHDWKGFTLMEMGRLEEAANELNVALQLEPLNPRIHLHLGMAYERLGRLPEALMEYQSAVQYDPDFSEAYYEIGMVDLGQKKLGEAKIALQRAHMLDPDNSMVWAGLDALARSGL